MLTECDEYHTWKRREKPLHHLMQVNPDAWCASRYDRRCHSAPENLPTRVPMSHFKHHVFFCCNQRAPGEACCNNHGAGELRAYAKDRIKALGLSGAGKARINSAGCLDRCELGPVLVVYPEAVWYTYVDEEDIDEIIAEHLVHGRVVERLKV
jgi:(2Fe-2S) ferredoxin